MLRRGALLVVLAALLLGHAHAQTNSSSTQPEETNCGVGNKSECMSECTAPATALAVPEEVVLVLGNSGSGKSTLAKFLSKQDGDMVAVQENNDYLILGDGIGSSIESVTTVPELFRDNETGTSYFDCPGFEDTRGPCSEVTTTYFMKDIARHARRVKVLLLAPHFAVRKGQDRGDFLTMLKHAAAMLKSPSKMAHSLALVVSKVDAPFVKVRGRYSKVPDREVARGVAAFLSKDVRPYLAAMAEDAGVDQEEKAVLANAVKIVDVLLTESKGDYDRIGLFHAPDEEGVLDDIQIMRDGRQALTGLVHERLRYADVQPADFGFSVSARTRVFALDRARRLSTEFLAVLEEQSKSSKNQTAHAYEPIGDVRARQERYEELLQASAATSESLANSTSVEEFCERLDDHQKLGDMCGLLKVLQVVSDQPLVDQAVVTRTWTAPQQSFARWVDEKKQWNDFLLSTYQRCNSYTVQVKRRSWLRADEALSEILELSSAKTRVLQFNATGQNMSDLSALVSLVSRGPKATCLPDGVVVVEGESVLLSEALTLARGRCPGAPQLLEVHALNTFFIDDSVSLRGAALAVAAPRWEILGSPSINLDGEDGAPLGRVPWRVGSGGGERGQDGQQGNPGHPGGKFLGLGLEFIGGKVVVSVKGGAGGAGQDGGAGGNGRSGGGNGGNGGNGGAGGVGGQRGKAVVQPLGLGYVDVNDYFKLVEASGAPGSGGRGGLGGDFRPHTALRRKKRFVITSIVLGVLGAAAAGAGVYYATKPRQPEPAPYVPPRYEPPRYIPTYHSGARGQDGTMPWGQVAGGRSKWEQNRDFDRVWDSLSDRMKTYVELNRNHPYLKKELQSFLHVLQEDEDRRTDIYHDPYDYK